MGTTMNTISARIDSKLKTQAETLFDQLGKQVVRLRKIPFEIALDTPNDETIAAMAEANEIASGKRKAKSYKNANAMIKDILGE